MSDMRDAFEKIFPIPQNCIRCGDGYAATDYNAWDAHSHCKRWEGFKAAQSQPAQEEITDAERYRHVRANPAMLLHLSNKEFDAAIDKGIRASKGEKT